MPKLITGNFLTEQIKVVKSKGVKINQLAEYWGVDRNTIAAWKRKKENYLHMNGAIKILIADMHSNIDHIKSI